MRRSAIPTNPTMNRRAEIGRPVNGARNAALFLPLFLAHATPGLAITQVTTTTYHYNADHALTAVTTQVDSQPSTTVYLTWDNFVPNTTDPTTGTVLGGNGNLRGFGPTP